MKKLLSLFLALLMLTGCAVDPAKPSEETTAASSDPVVVPTRTPAQTASDSFGLGYVFEYGFNPYTCMCTTNRPVISLVYEGLFVVGSGFQAEPVLCERFAVSENGKRYVFRLCEGVTFSDGTALTAWDVKASLETARGSDYYGSRFSKVESFTVVDEDTLRIDLLYPYENLPLLLDVPIVKSGTTYDSRPVGSGPYAFDGDDGGLSLRRRDDWWQDRKAPIDFERIILTRVSNPTELRDSFEFGDTTLVCADLNAPAAVGYRCDYELWNCPTTTLQYLGFNLNGGLFVSKGFRAAVTHIIDREGFVSSIYKGFAEPAYLPCSPSCPLYDADLAEIYSYDRDAFVRAKSGADAFPWDYTGTLLVCSADASRVEMAYRIVDALQAEGIRIEVKSVDAADFEWRLGTGLYDMYLGEARLSANFDLSEFFRAYGGLCFGGLANKTMEQLCRDALENTGNCYDLYKQVMDNGYFCPILFKANAVMANRGRITSLQPAVDNVFHLAGGRTLAEASASYEELTEETP